MTKVTILFLVLISTLNISFTILEDESPKLNFDVVYVGKTGEINIPGNKMEIFNYIRFYEDGTVYTQSVNSYDPQAVSKWFGKGGIFERSGSYKIKKDILSFTVSNDESPDKQLEGAKTDQYSGKIVSDNKLVLTIIYAGGDSKEVEFKGIKIE